MNAMSEIAKHPGGRPPIYVGEIKQKIQEHVLNQLSAGRALSRICNEDEGMPNYSTLDDWQQKDEEFAQKVVRARERGVERLLDETIEIADDSSNDVHIEFHDRVPVAKINGDAIQRAKLRVDTRQKYAQMIAPRKYGPKMDITSGGEKLPPPAPAVIVDNRMQSLIAIAARRREQGEIIELEAEPDLDDLMS